VANHFNIPAMVCVNKCDINAENTRAIEDYCEERGIAIAGSIPYAPEVTKAMLNRLSVVEYPCAKVTDEVKRIWRKVEGCLFGANKEQCPF